MVKKFNVMSRYMALAEVKKIAINLLAAFKEAMPQVDPGVFSTAACIHTLQVQCNEWSDVRDVNNPPEDDEDEGPLRPNQIASDHHEMTASLNFNFFIADLESVNFEQFGIVIHHHVPHSFEAAGVRLIMSRSYPTTGFSTRRNNTDKTLESILQLNMHWKYYEREIVAKSQERTNVG